MCAFVRRVNLERKKKKRPIFVERKAGENSQSNASTEIMLWDMMDRAGSPLFRIRVSLQYETED